MAGPGARALAEALHGAAGDKVAAQASRQAVVVSVDSAVRAATVEYPDGLPGNRATHSYAGWQVPTPGDVVWVEGAEDARYIAGPVAGSPGPTATGPITATGPVNAPSFTTGNAGFSEDGAYFPSDLDIGGAIEATGSIGSALNLAAGQDVRVQRSVFVENGGITVYTGGMTVNGIINCNTSISSGLNLVCEQHLQAGRDVRAGRSLYADTGGCTVAGNVNAGISVSAQQNVIASLDLTAGQDVNVQRSVFVQNGGITVYTGGITANGIINCNTSISSGFNLVAANQVRANGVVLTSDAAMKRDVVDLDADAVDRDFGVLRPRRFQLLADADDERPRVGFVAQEMPAAVRRVVNDPEVDAALAEADADPTQPSPHGQALARARVASESGPVEVQGYDLGEVVALAVAKVQALERQVADLAARVDAQEAQ